MSAEPITIRRVSVEFLRPGPSHNQLLSPYTHYLAVCNDAGAAVVTRRPVRSGEDFGLCGVVFGLGDRAGVHEVGELRELFGGATGRSGLLHVGLERVILRLCLCHVPNHVLNPEDIRHRLAAGQVLPLTGIGALTMVKTADYLSLACGYLPPVIRASAPA